MYLKRTNNICHYVGCDKPIHGNYLCHSHYLRGWRKLIGYSKERFGGLRKDVLERDDYKCIMCGMTNADHIKKWGREITIDHIDHNGRYADQPNNLMDNLQTLCLRCHGHKDAIKHGRYSKYRGESETK
jgi:5-methylcytosine-specific restriction endonuclease McrA